MYIQEPLQKITFTLLAGLAFASSVVLPISKVEAVDLVTLDSITFDKSIIKDTNITYAPPTKILVVPLFLPNTDLRVTDAEWYKGLFYYTVQRLGFSTIPFQYVVGSSGDIYASGASDEMKIPIKDLGNNNIIVGYLANTSVNTFDSRAEGPLKNLLLDIANRNAINPNQIYLSGLKFSRDENTRLVTISSQPLFADWNSALKSIVNSIRKSYAPVKKVYKLQVEALTLPSDQVLPAQEVDGSITIKNVGTTNIYGGADSSLILGKKDGSKSLFYLNNAWTSQSQISLMADNQILSPGQDLKFNFKLKSPLYLGQIKENFVLQTEGNNQVNADNVTLQINVKRGSQRIVQINNTELNAVNVHSTPSTVSPVIGKVESGGRFLVLQDDPSSFIKIDLNNGSTGWIAGWLTTTI